MRRKGVFENYQFDCDDDEDDAEEEEEEGAWGVSVGKKNERDEHSGKVFC